MPVEVELKLTSWPVRGETGEYVNDAAGACAAAEAGSASAASPKSARPNSLMPSKLPTAALQR